jgi:hypothetical protein
VKICSIETLFEKHSHRVKKGTKSEQISAIPAGRQVLSKGKSLNHF